jgi:putative oxidoreductase
MAIGLLILRLAVGLTMAAHGSQKLLGWWGGGGLRTSGAMMEQLGMRPGLLFAALAGLGELGGGLLLTLGLVTPLAAAAITAVMVVAIGTVHVNKGFWAHEGGLEYNLVVAMAALTLAFTGPGAWALDAVLGITHDGVGWGLAAAAIGLIGGGIPLAARNVRGAHHVHA